MRLHRNQVPSLSRKIVKALVDAEDIEVSNRSEVERDIESVLVTYLTDVERVVSRAREMAQQRGLPHGEFGRIKQLAADQAGIKVGDDALDYVLNQLLQILMHSNSVDEVYAEDHQLRRRMRPFVLSEAEEDTKLEQQVRSKLKHVEEGSRLWEIEYARMKADIKRRRGM